MFAQRPMCRARRHWLAPVTRPPSTKHLVLELYYAEGNTKGGRQTDGIAFGPKLSNGRKSLVAMADDSFPVRSHALKRQKFKLRLAFSDV